MLGKGSNSHGSGASISCVGATNSVTFYDARLIDSENAVDVSSQKIVINGIEYEMAEGEGMPTDIFAFQDEPLPQFPPPVGYEWVYAYTIKNISNQDKRIEFVTEPENQNLFTSVLANNPTSIVFSKNRFGVCLARYIEDIDLQSCNFGQITIENMLIWNGVSSSTPHLKSWFKLVNVETNETIAFKECNGTNDDSLFAAAFEDFLMQVNASMKLSAELIPNEWAGGVNRFVLTNTTDNNLQLRFSATIGNEGDLVVTDGEGVVSEEFNPSAYDRYKEVKFCLAPPVSENPNNEIYTLTVDDKGLQPSDNIYSGTITPANSTLSLIFRIQWFSSMEETASNGRVFYVDADNIQFNANGAQWYVDLNSLPNYLQPSSFATNGIYECAIYGNVVINDPSIEIISDAKNYIV